MYAYITYRLSEKKEAIHKIYDGLLQIGFDESCANSLLTDILESEDLDDIEVPEEVWNYHWEMNRGE